MYSLKWNDYEKPKHLGRKNTKYLKWVRGLPCIQCGNPESEPHHIIAVGMGIMSGKASDIHSIPLCRKHHNLVHSSADSYPQAKWLLITQDKAQEAGEL